MGTISKKIADEVIAGLFNDDDPKMIVEYTNCFDGGKCYGLICGRQPLDTYRETDFVINPRVYWVHPSIKERVNGFSLSDK